MFIKEIEFVNFKSFGKKVKIPFYEGFTAISGPNGSGKSNIIDGILFALGLSGSKTMRADKLTDLIFNDAKSKQPDFAQVTITFDNTDRKAPVEADEFEISRKIKQTKDNYYSYYYFNGKAVSLTEVHELLGKAGVTPEGYNVVMQGDISQITAKMSPIERRKIIDEIAGVSEFDEKKQKSLAELDIVKEQIEKIDIIIEEVTAQLERLSSEREHALKYRTLREQKQKYEGYLILSKLKDAKTELVNVENEILKYEALEAESEEKIKEREAEQAEAESELNALNTEIRQKGEDEQIRIKKEIEEIKGQISRARESIGVLEREESGFESKRRDLFVKIDSRKKEIEEHEKTLADEKRKEDAVLKEQSDRNTEKVILASKIAEIDKKFAEQTSVSNRKREELEQLKNEKNQLIRDEDRLTDALRRKASEIKDIEDQITDAEENAKNAGSDTKVAEYEISKLEEETDKLKKDTDDLESAHKRFSDEKKKFENQILEKEKEFEIIEARVRATEVGSTYSHAVEEIIKASKREDLYGIIGAVANLGRADQTYAKALEIAAGAKMQAIIVETDADAEHAINYLKRKNLGRATFLPLNKMENRRELQDLSDRVPGFVGYAVDLIDYDYEYEPAFWYVFRDTVIVDTLENARRSLGRYRMVTLDGDTLEKSGAMIGGSVSQKSRVSFAATERDRLDTLGSEIRQIYVKREEMITKTTDLESKINAGSKRIAAISNEISKMEMRIEEIKDRENRLSEILGAKQSSLDTLGEEREQLKKEMNEVIEQRLAKEEVQKALEAEIQEIEAELNNPELEEFRRKAQRIDDEIQRLKERLSDIKSDMNAVELAKQHAESIIEETKTELEELEEKKRTGKDNIAALMAEIAGHEGRQRQNEERELEITNELKELRDRREALEQKADDARKKSEKIRFSYEEVRRHKDACFLTKQTLEKQFVDLSNEVKERGLDEIADDEEIPSYQTVYITIESLEKEMEALEPVNMRAIDEYDAVNDRKEELSGRRDTLFNEREELLTRIDQYEKLKRDTFMEAYNGINENFTQVFFELADGHGELILENPNDPFAGGMTLHAQPKGKNILRLEAMSGGEKSLTALAFIIAIQGYRPAPFYVFDEVDQNLDGWNVERVAERVEKSARVAQFIVISLRKPMLEQSDRIIGVTQLEGTTSITGVKSA
ncbi:Chromosome partition protein Smc [Methanimicrococcus sp. At1]|uniref:Chromosome partition protein Smc n=1 Tax=Methanimicrococcus hacksteinii TaxID=3028293 RepID=A0ABU3VM41_9EURY|nr:chromosome segregation protein SMC [Methanimicrococcus sp. At1]MDV0444480.1 Chromosome partition protein Smc [Methanimicrococcus sp. At1]